MFNTFYKLRSLRSRIFFSILRHCVNIWLLVVNIYNHKAESLISSDPKRSYETNEFFSMYFLCDLKSLISQGVTMISGWNKSIRPSFNFFKFDKFQFVSYVKPPKSAFLRMFGNKNTSNLLVISFYHTLVRKMLLEDFSSRLKPRKISQQHFLSKVW